MWKLWTADISADGGRTAPDGTFLGADGTDWEDKGEMWGACFAGHFHEEFLARGRVGRAMLLLQLPRSLRASVPERFWVRVQQSLDNALWMELEILPELRRRRRR